MLKKAEDVSQFWTYDLSYSENLAQQPLFHSENNKIQKHRNRKNHNQYFTPEFAVEKALSFISKIKPENIIDPAVGNGAFLKIALKKWKNAKLFGIDIDGDVILELNKSKLPCSYFTYANSLLSQTWQLLKIKEVLSKGGFDLVVGNPPFSSWFHRIEAKDILSNYELAKSNGDLKKSQAIEILFLEIFIKLAKKRGFIVIVLPDGILSNPQYQYVREFILKNTKVLHIISLSRNVFEETSAKTSILILQKQNKNNLNYLTELHDMERAGRVNNTVKVSEKDLIKRMDYYYYHNLQKSSLQELIDRGVKFKQLKDFVIYCKTGKTLYGKEREFSKRGLRFLHATNITDIGINYKKDERFIDPSSKMNFLNAHAKVDDILFIRVGVGCAGRVAIVDTEGDEGVATDYIHFFGVKDISPYFLVVYLKTKFGRDSINLLRHGVGTVSINKTDLLSLPIPFVPKHIQIEVEKMYKNILDEYRENRETDNLNLNDRMRNLIYYVEQYLQKGNRLGIP
ncbi:MAG: N-6 DNA methylase [Nitrospinae bacterium]|nr:N-6 DNA methylase [Nitrospinota bacterium]